MSALMMNAGAAWYKIVSSAVATTALMMRSVTFEHVTIMTAPRYTYDP